MKCVLSMCVLRVMKPWIHDTMTRVVRVSWHVTSVWHPWFWFSPVQPKSCRSVDSWGVEADTGGFVKSIQCSLESRVSILEPWLYSDKSTRGQRKHSFESNLDFAYFIPLFQFWWYIRDPSFKGTSVSLSKSRDTGTVPKKNWPHQFNE